MTLPGTMPVAVYRRQGVIDVTTQPVPEVGERDILIEVSHCGVCGSDLHFVLEGWGRPDSIQGHEYAGVVVAVGSAVTEWSVGDRVVGGGDGGCGRCEYCTTGRPSLCIESGTPGVGHYQGAFAAYKLVSADNAIAVPEGMALRVAALTEPLAVALHGITRSGVQPAQRALVCGAGPIGALSTAALAAMGVEVTVSEPHPARRALATDVGAVRAIHPEDLPSTDGLMPNDIVEGAFDVVLECSGHREAMEQGLGQLKRTGTLVLVGAGIRRPRFDPNRILLNELVVTGANCYDAGGFHAALDLLASGRLATDRLIEPDDVPLAGMLEAMHALASGERAGKVMIVPRDGGTDGGTGNG
jgi:(R,R)-butanediol dehydrogenase / meso-butanediol dehydrogenase / diacetyl reductase